MIQDATKRTQIIIADLLAQGLVEQLPNAIRPTETGLARAEQVWMSISDNDKFLLIPYLRGIINLKYKE